MKHPAQLFLKPFPFCGSTDFEIKTKDEYKDLPSTMHIECNGCDTDVWLFPKAGTSYNKVCHTMIEKWNRRVAA